MTAWKDVPPTHKGDLQLLLIRSWSASRLTCKALDEWPRKQDNLPGRPEAIGGLLRLG
jgi:hypothetical protein